MCYIRFILTNAHARALSKGHEGVRVPALGVLLGETVRVEPERVRVDVRVVVESVDRDVDPDALLYEQVRPGQTVGLRAHPGEQRERGVSSQGLCQNRTNY